MNEMSHADRVRSYEQTYVNKVSIAYNKAYDKLSKIVDKYIDANISKHVMDQFLSEVIEYEEYEMYFYLGNKEITRTVINSALNKLAKDRDCMLFWDYYSCFIHGNANRALERYCTGY